MRNVLQYSIKYFYKYISVKIKICTNLDEIKFIFYLTLWTLKPQYTLWPLWREMDNFWHITRCHNFAPTPTAKNWSRVKVIHFQYLPHARKFFSYENRLGAGVDSWMKLNFLLLYCVSLGVSSYNYFVLIGRGRVYRVINFTVLVHINWKLSFKL